MRETVRHKEKHFLRRLVILTLLIICAYFGVVVYNTLHSKYSYETVMPYTMTDSVFVEGLVLFEEIPVPGGGMLGYLAADGERVSAGAKVAEVYTDPSQSGIRAELLEVEGKIALLQKSQNTSAAQVDMLLSQSRTAVYDLMEQLERGDYSRLAQSRDGFLLAQNRIQITTGDVQDFNGSIAALQQQKEALEASLSGVETVRVPKGGYFVSAPKMVTLAVDSATARAMPAAELARLLESGAEQPHEEAAGKVITSYRWYFCGSCTLAQASRFENGKAVNIRFPGKAEEPLPAKVIDIARDEQAGVAKLTLQCEQVGAEVLCLGQEKAEVIFETYRGLRIRADAVRMVKEEPAESTADSQEEEAARPVDENYRNGVYIRYGSVARFRSVEPIYSNEQYILVPLDGKVGSKNEIRMYDEVIVEGIDLRNGKLL